MCPPFDLAYMSIYISLSLSLFMYLYLYLSLSLSIYLYICILCEGDTRNSKEENITRETRAFQVSFGIVAVGDGDVSTIRISIYVYLYLTISLSIYVSISISISISIYISIYMYTLRGRHTQLKRREETERNGAFQVRFGMVCVGDGCVATVSRRSIHIFI